VRAARSRSGPAGCAARTRAVRAGHAVGAAPRRQEKRHAASRGATTAERASRQELHRSRIPCIDPRWPGSGLHGPSAPPSGPMSSRRSAAQSRPRSDSAQFQQQLCPGPLLCSSTMQRPSFVQHLQLRPSSPSGPTHIWPVSFVLAQIWSGGPINLDPL
jgi:hypothetical protein